MNRVWSFVGFPNDGFEYVIRETTFGCLVKRASRTRLLFDLGHRDSVSLYFLRGAILADFVVKTVFVLRAPGVFIERVSVLSSDRPGEENNDVSWSSFLAGSWVPNIQGLVVGSGEDFRVVVTAPADVTPEVTVVGDRRERHVLRRERVASIEFLGAGANARGG